MSTIQSTNLLSARQANELKTVKNVQSEAALPVSPQKDKKDAKSLVLASLAGLAVLGIATFGCVKVFKLNRLKKLEQEIAQNIQDTITKFRTINCGYDDIEPTITKLKNNKVKIEMPTRDTANFDKLIIICDDKGVGDKVLRLGKSEFSSWYTLSKGLDIHNPSIIKKYTRIQTGVDGVETKLKTLMPDETTRTQSIIRKESDGIYSLTSMSKNKSFTDTGAKTKDNTWIVHRNISKNGNPSEQYKLSSGQKPEQITHIKEAFDAETLEKVKDFWGIIE